MADIGSAGGHLGDDDAGPYGIMVEDRTRKISRDFYAAPVSRGSITGGYLPGVVIIGIIMSLVALAVSEGYVWLNGGRS